MRRAVFLFMKWVYFPNLEFFNKICFTILVIREQCHILENRVKNIKSIFESIRHQFWIELEWLLNLRCSWSSSLIRISFCEIPAKISSQTTTYSGFILLFIVMKSIWIAGSVI